MHSSAVRPVVRWRTDLEKSAVVGAFDRRDWVRCAEGSADWHVYWASVGTVKALFNPENGIRVSDNQ
jgi:hypothetical protein